MKIAFRLFPLFLLAALSQQTLAAPEDVVARVNGAPILQIAVDRASAAAGNTPEARQAALERLIAEELLWQEAQRNKTDKHPEVNNAMEAARRLAAVNVLVRDRIKAVPPSEEQVRRHYEQVVAQLGPNEYRYSLIQNREENTVRAAAKELAEGADFATVARRASRAPSAARGGEQDWISFPLPPSAGRTQGLPLTLAEALARLKPGQISEPLLLDNGVWALLKLEAVRPTLVPPYEAIRSSLRLRLQQHASEAAATEYVGQLMKRSRIEIPGQTNTPQK